MSQNLTKGIEAAVTVLKSIPDFIKAFLELIQTPHGWIMLVVIFPWFFLNKNVTNVFSFFVSKKTKRLGSMEACASTTEVGNTEALDLITGLSAVRYFNVQRIFMLIKLTRFVGISSQKKISYN